MFPRRSFLAKAGCLAIAGLLALGASVAQAQPLKGTLRLVVGYPPGGGSDRAARLVADRLGEQLGVTVVVENKPGAGGRLAAQYVKEAPASQNLVMLGNPAVMVVAPEVFDKVGYDPVADFRPLSQITSYEFVVAVGSAVPVQSLSTLMAWLRANPEKANYGVPATGSLPHFFGLMLEDAAKVKGQMIGYKGSAPLLTDLIGGQIAYSLDSLDASVTQHEAGKIKMLAVSGEARSPFAPDVPTFKEVGVDLAAMGWNVFFAPRGMPEATAAQVAKAIEAVMKQPQTQRAFVDSKLSPVVSSQAQTEAMLKQFRAQWVPVIQKSGYKP